MARPSKLTPRQLTEIERRVSEGQPIRALAREYKIAESTLRSRVSAQSQKIKAVVAQIVATEQALNSLPVSAQQTAQNLAHRLLNTTNSLAALAEAGSAIAQKLSTIAHKQAQKVSEDNPMESGAQLQAVSALTELANEAAKPALALLAANKGAMQPGTPDAAENAADAFEEMRARREQARKAAP